MTYDVTLLKAGVVSLAAVAPLVNLKCKTDGSVRVQISEAQAALLKIEDIYPIGSVFVIDINAFGECSLSDITTAPSGETEEQRNVRFTSQKYRRVQDAFILIEEVLGSPSDAILRGTAGSYYSTFEEARVSISAVNRQSALQSSSAINTDGRRRLPVELALEEPTYLYSKTLFERGKFDVSFTGGLLVRGELESFDFNISRGLIPKIDAKFVYTNDWELSIAANATLSISKRTETLKIAGKIIDLLIYGFPKINFNKSILPLFKLDIFFELDALAEVIEAAVTLKASRTYIAEKARFTYVLSGTVARPILGSPVKEVLTEPYSTENLPAFDAPLTASVSMSIFIGVEARLSVYFPLFHGYLAVEAGVQATASVRLPTFRPILNSEIALRGQCDVCHDVQVYASLVAKNIRIGIILGIENSKSADSKEFQFPNLHISSRFLIACLFPSSGANVCGSNCCFTDKLEVCATRESVPQCVQSVVPTTPKADPPTPNEPAPPSISSSNSLQPLPTSPPEPSTPGIQSRCHGDPHLQTFDGISFDCHGVGEFVLAKSKISNFEVRGRFKSVSTRRTVTVTEGVVVSTAGSSTVQIHVAVNATSTTVIKGCPIFMFVDGISRNIVQSSGQKGVTVSKSSESSLLISYDSELSVSVRIHNSRTFQCYLDVRLFIPDSISSKGGVQGLFGIPNGNFSDDWNTPSGQILPVPRTQTQRRTAMAYNYCTTHWCIRQASESLFTFEEGTTFEDFNQCDRLFGTAPIIQEATQEVQDLCGIDESCLIDGTVGQLEDARRSLSTQFEIDNEDSTDFNLHFSPTAIAVDRAVNILITMDVRNRPASTISPVQRFDIFRVSSDNGTVGELSIGSLFDNGLSVNSDAVTGDQVFSGVIALKSRMAGERLGFQAVPVEKDEVKTDSILTTTKLNAVRVYSQISGLGSLGSSDLQTSVSSIDGLELVIQYSWPREFQDLDTQTKFLDD